MKIVGKWNDLPANVVEAATIGSFPQLQEEIDESLMLSSDQLERTSDKLGKQVSFKAHLSGSGLG